MRHLLSILAGLIIAPATWVLVGLSQAKFASATRGADGFTFGDLTTPLALLAAAGLVFGLIAVTKISPLGPALGGLIFIGGQLMYAWRPMTMADLLSAKNIFGETGVLTLPASTGVAMILGAAMLTALFSVGRWRTWPKFDDPDDAFLGESAAPIGSPTPAGARHAYGGAFGGEPAPPARPLSPPAAAPPGQPAHAFSGSSPSSDQGRYEPFGYVSDEPTRQANPSSWPDPLEPSWRPSAEDDRTESTTRLPPGSSGDSYGSGQG
ncbi:MAG: hypothetical protein ACRDT8_20605, partial [Micromonosporaceae bacterium]